MGIARQNKKYMYLQVTVMNIKENTKIFTRQNSPY